MAIYLFGHLRLIYQIVFCLWWRGTAGELFGFKTKPGNHWRWSKERALKAIKQGILRPNPRTGKPEYLVTKQEEIIGSAWFDIPAYSFTTGFPTEKSNVHLTFSTAC